MVSFGGPGKYMPLGLGMYLLRDVSAKQTEWTGRVDLY